MPKLSAALLLHRVRGTEVGIEVGTEVGIEVLIVHPGGPFWSRRDDGVWSLPKGEYEQGEDPLAAARREFEEEIGISAPHGDATELGTIKQAGGKVVTAFALRGDLDLSNFHSNTFEMEWPKGSGRTRDFPEVDKAAWFGIEDARKKLLQGQNAFLDMLSARLAAESQGMTQRPESD